MKAINKILSYDGTRRFEVVASENILCSAYTYKNELGEFVVAIKSDLFDKQILAIQKNAPGDREILDLVAENISRILPLSTEEWICARNHMGFTRAQAADVLNISLGSLNHIECGSREISPGLRVRMFRLMRDWSLCVSENAPQGVRSEILEVSNTFNVGKSVVEKASR